MVEASGPVTIAQSIDSRYHGQGLASHHHDPLVWSVSIESDLGVGYKDDLVLFTSEDLNSITSNFDDEKNLIGPTQFGKVYRGMIPHEFACGIRSGEVTVKIWDEKSDILWLRDDECIMVNEEVKFLTDPSVNHHQNLVKLIGYCCDGQLKAVVYDLKPLDTLHNMATRDGLSWVQMIKVAHGFAQLLEFLHGQETPCVVFNVDPLHIMLDQDCNPILFDFGLLSGGIIEWNFAKKFIHMSPPYVDSCYAVGGPGPAPFCDVHAYGIILLGLITKRIVDMKITRTHGYVLADDWAKKNYTPKCSLVHSSLEKQHGYYDCDGPIITELGMRCVEFYPQDRPTMKEVVACLDHPSTPHRLLPTNMSVRIYIHVQGRHDVIFWQILQKLHLHDLVPGGIDASVVLHVVSLYVNHCICPHLSHVLHVLQILC